MALKMTKIHKNPKEKNIINLLDHVIENLKKDKDYDIMNEEIEEIQNLTYSNFTKKEDVSKAENKINKIINLLKDKIKTIELEMGRENKKIEGHIKYIKNNRD